MPRLNRRSKSADRSAAKKAAASRARKAKARAQLSETASLASRIRALDGSMSRADIARYLGTSTTYVRVVLNHRVGGGMSRYDIAYEKKTKHRQRNAQRAYHAVSADERQAIWQKARHDVKASGADLAGYDLKKRVSTLAVCRIRKRGREIIAMARDGETVSGTVSMVSNP